MTDGPLLWYLNRSTGFVILGLFTMTTALGVLATSGRAGHGVPRFVTQSFHRNVALLSVVMLGAHVTTAVVDTFVDIRWWQAFVPWYGASYLPLWLGFGTLALDVVLVVTATSLLRTRLRHRSWRTVHLLSYVGWALAVTHGLGIGTDVRTGAAWARGTTVACIAVVLAAAVLRLGRVLAARSLTDVRPS